MTNPSSEQILATDLERLSVEVSLTNRTRVRN